GDLDGALLSAGEGTPVRVVVERDPVSFALPLRFFQVAAARALMKAFPDLAHSYLRPGKHHAADVTDDGLTGLACLELQFGKLPPLAAINADLQQVNQHMCWGRIVEVLPAEGAIAQPDKIVFEWTTSRSLRDLDRAIVQLLDSYRALHTRQRHGEGYRYISSP